MIESSIAHVNWKSLLSPEAHVELSTDKPESSDRKELSASSGPRPASSFTQSPAAMTTTSLEQVQATPGLSFSSVWNQLVTHQLMLC